MGEITKEEFEEMKAILEDWNLCSLLQ
jgi:hypothetical protein